MHAKIIHSVDLDEQEQILLKEKQTKNIIRKI
jgi:hypothetical protein